MSSILSAGAGGGVDLSALFASKRDQIGAAAAQDPAAAAGRFQTADRNADGAVSFDEFSSGSLGGSAFAEQVFASIDADGDGGVTEDELTRFAEDVSAKLAEIKDKVLAGDFGSLDALGLGGGAGFGGLDGAGGGGGAAALDQLLASLAPSEEGADADQDAADLAEQLRQAIAEHRQSLSQKAEQAYAEGAAALAT
ncbi:MAG: hypothetical protein AAFR16_13280, partial [Pseudomonadota bacterium]